VRFVDSHLHLDGPDAPATLEFAKSAGVLAIACGVDRRSSERLIEMAKSCPETLVPFVGVHPSEAVKNSGFSWLEDACKSAAGIGEIGLDPTYSRVGEGTPQSEAFRLQVELAERLAKPVQVHSRQAEMECLGVLSRARLSGVLMHWLDSEEALPKAMELGYYVSFGPALLYSKRLQRAALKADPSLVLLETDSPVSYGPLGGAHGPMLIPTVAFKLSELTGRGFQDTLEECSRNSLRFLGR
jgi:TatD DNase family protein